MMMMMMMISQMPMWHCRNSAKLIFRVSLTYRSSAALRPNWSSFQGDTGDNVVSVIGWKPRFSLLPTIRSKKSKIILTVINHTCKLFDRAVPEKEHPLAYKKSRENLRVVAVVVRAKNGMRSNAKYANEHCQYDHKSRQLFDLKFKQHVHVQCNCVAVGIKISLTHAQLSRNVYKQESLANANVSARQPCWSKTDFDVKLALKVILGHLFWNKLQADKG